MSLTKYLDAITPVDSIKSLSNDVKRSIQKNDLTKIPKRDSVMISSEARINHYLDKIANELTTNNSVQTMIADLSAEDIEEIKIALKNEHEDCDVEVRQKTPKQPDTTNPIIAAQYIIIVTRKTKSSKEEKDIDHKKRVEESIVKKNFNMYMEIAVEVRSSSKVFVDGEKNTKHSTIIQLQQFIRKYPNESMEMAKAGIKSIRVDHGEQADKMLKWLVAGRLYNVLYELFGNNSGKIDYDTITKDVHVDGPIVDEFKKIRWDYSNPTNIRREHNHVVDYNRTTNRNTLYSIK